MTKVSMQVRGIQRNVYLEKYIGNDRWLARTYVGPRSKTTVSGIYKLTKTGARRFTPTGINAQLV